jgi:hypothetical protein
MLERIAETVAAASAEYGAQNWPDGPDRDGKLQFVYDLVISSITAYCEMEPLYRTERPVPSTN